MFSKNAPAERNLQLTSFGTGGVRGSGLIRSYQYSDTYAGIYIADAEGTTTQTTTSASSGFVNTDKGSVNGSTNGSVTGTTNADAATDNAGLGPGIGDAYSYTGLVGVGAFGGGFTTVPAETEEALIVNSEPPFLAPDTALVQDSNGFLFLVPQPEPIAATGGFGLAGGFADLYTDVAADFAYTDADATSTGSVSFNSITVASNEAGTAGGTGAGTIVGTNTADTSGTVDESFGFSVNDLETGFANYGVGVFGAPIAVTLPFAPVGIPTLP